MLHKKKKNTLHNRLNRTISSLKYNKTSSLITYHIKDINLRLDLKTDKDGANLIEMGRAFQSLGPTTEKVQSPLHFSFDLGIYNNLWLDDQRDLDEMLDGRLKQLFSPKIQ